MPMINLIKRGKDLMPGMAEFAVERYVQQRHLPRTAHRYTHTLALRARSIHDHGNRRLRTPGSE
jgi:hypothetical protein